jgi:hypothetical protein
MLNVLPGVGVRMTGLGGVLTTSTLIDAAASLPPPSRTVSVMVRRPTVSKR